ncbi:acetyl-CoA carboxylase biotin carboxyl carrier protein [Streptococcus rifensis]
MQLSDIKDLMAQFDQSSLKEFSYKNAEDELVFSKNENKELTSVPVASSQPASPVVEVASVSANNVTETVEHPSSEVSTAEGDVVESPLVGVVYLSPGPDKPAFVSVGDQVRKGQTLLIIEAMKVMNEIPAPRDGVVTEIMVNNEEVADFGKGLVRIK